MNKKKFLIAFAIVALLQLLVPAKMILDRETILSDGREYRFRTAPIDPSDPFRGKYIVLNFTQTSVPEKDHADFAQSDIYACISTGADGFAKVDSVVKSKPDIDHVKVTYSGGSEGKLFFSFPFDRFYLEESKAPKAEKIYNRVSRDTTKPAYAVVKILDGESVLSDVRIGDVSVTELAADR